MRSLRINNVHLMTQINGDVHHIVQVNLKLHLMIIIETLKISQFSHQIKLRKLNHKTFPLASYHEMSLSLKTPFFAIKNHSRIMEKISERTRRKMFLYKSPPSSGATNETKGLIHSLASMHCFITIVQNGNALEMQMSFGEKKKGKLKMEGMCTASF